MDSLPEKLKKADGTEITREEAIGGYKLLMILHTASW